MPYFDYAGKKIYFNTYGSRGDFLLLLHAGAMSSRMFLKEISRFYGKYFKVYTFDYPGLGKSSKAGPIPDNYWIEAAHVAIALSKRLGVDSTFVIGTDAGAVAALNMAIMAPELVKKAVCDGFLGVNIDPALADLIKDSREASKKGAMAAAWFLIHGFGWKKRVDADTEKIMKSRGEAALIPGGLKDIKCPVAFTAGNPDPAIPDTEKTLMTYTKMNSLFSYKLMSKPGHMSMLNDNYGFSRFAKEFFGRSPV